MRIEVPDPSTSCNTVIVLPLPGTSAFLRITHMNKKKSILLGFVPSQWSTSWWSCSLVVIVPSCFFLACSCLFLGGTWYHSCFNCAMAIAMMMMINYELLLFSHYPDSLNSTPVVEVEVVAVLLLVGNTSSVSLWSYLLHSPQHQSKINPSYIIYEYDCSHVVCSWPNPTTTEYHSECNKWAEYSSRNVVRMV